jgi:hypothetical protein
MFNYKPSDWKMDNTQLKRATILKTPVTQKYDVGAVLGSYAPPTVPPISRDYFLTPINRFSMSSGNYSVVKLAIEKGTGKEWAAKIITKKDAGPKGLQMLQTEVDILSSCEHPNIVRLSEVFETDEHYYIIMELYTTLALPSPSSALFSFFVFLSLLYFVVVACPCCCYTCSHPLRLHLLQDQGR